MKKGIALAIVLVALTATGALAYGKKLDPGKYYQFSSPGIPPIIISCIGGEGVVYTEELWPGINITQLNKRDVEGRRLPYAAVGVNSQWAKNIQELPEFGFLFARGSIAAQPQYYGGGSYYQPQPQGNYYQPQPVLVPAPTYYNIPSRQVTGYVDTYFGGQLGYIIQNGILRLVDGSLRQLTHEAVRSIHEHYRDDRNHRNRPRRYNN
jgi:hypothetical protein